jgi:hypothetical protein
MYRRKIALSCFSSPAEFSRAKMHSPGLPRCPYGKLGAEAAVGYRDALPSRRVLEKEERLGFLPGGAWGLQADLPKDVRARVAVEDLLYSKSFEVTCPDLRSHPAEPPVQTTSGVDITDGLPLGMIAKNGQRLGKIHCQTQCFFNYRTLRR